MGDGDNGNPGKGLRLRHSDVRNRKKRAPAPGCCCCCSTQRADAPDPQAQEPLSLWTEVWPTQPAAAVKHTTRTLSGPPSTRAAIAMDGCVFRTTREFTRHVSCLSRQFVSRHAKEWISARFTFHFQASRTSRSSRLYSLNACAPLHSTCIETV